MAPPAKRQRAQGYAAPSPLENLPHFLLARILDMAGPRAAATLACTSSTLRAAASSEELWRRLCAQDFGLVAPLDPSGCPLPSFMGAYKAWFQSFGMYPLPLVKRVKTFWDSFKSWLSEYFPEALETLAEGVSDFYIRNAERDLGFELPMPTKLLYCFCNGQMHYRKRLASCGVIGGYEFNSEKVNVHLLPLKKIVETTKLLRGEKAASGTSMLVVVAESSDQQKSFLLDCLTGQLYVGTKSLKSDGGMMLCVPSIRASEHGKEDMPLDGFLLWLEEHLRRLLNGLIKVQRYNPMSDARHISLYPEEPPSYSLSVAHGVKVRVSAVFVPEVSGINDDQFRYVYYYCIHLSLAEACVVDGKHYSSCQCQSFHLTIWSENNVLHDDWTCNIQLQRPGADKIIYRSYVSESRVHVSIKGTINFVPLRYHIPEGKQFDVNISPFLLRVPEYIY